MIDFVVLAVDDQPPVRTAVVGAERCANPRLPTEILDGPDLAATAATAPLRTITVRAGGQQFVLAVTQADDDERLGLMCVQHLRSNTGMLFDLHTDRTALFWMKDTVESLDIVWTTRIGVVTKVEKDVPASTMTTPNDRIARVSGTGRFVIELPADSAAAAGITVGSKVDFLH